MSETYLQLTNKILRRLKWNETTQSEFADPPDPIPQLKEYLNEAKDETLSSLGLDLVEKDLVFTTAEGILHTVATTVSPDVTVTEFDLGSGRTEFTSIGVGGKIICNLTYDSDITVDITGNAGGGIEDPLPHMITDVTEGGRKATVDYPWTDDTDNFTPTEWTIYKDAYDLDATVRQVLTATCNGRPLDLEFMQAQDIRRWHPEPSFGTPHSAAVYRSTVSGSIWKMQLYPAPIDRYAIHYFAVTQVPDLSAYSDTWELENEIVNMILDRAIYKALLMPTNNDPELAVALNQDIDRRIGNYTESHHPRDAGRRLRRQGPDESRHVTARRNVRLNWNVENPTA